MMLVDVEINAKVIEYSTPASVTKTLLTTLLDYGLVTLPTDYIKTALLPAIQTLGADAKLLWYDVLRSCATPTAAGPSRPVVSAEPGAIETSMPYRDLLAIVDPTTLRRWAIALGHSDDAESLLSSSPGLEFALPGAIAHTAHVSTRRAWSHDYLSTGFDREEFWRTRLAPVILASKFVTITDVNFLNVATRDEGNGALWLLNRIGEVRRKSTRPLALLRVISAIPDRYEQDEVGMREFAHRLVDCCQGGVESVDFVAGEAARLRPHLHTRTVRCATDHISRNMTFSDSVDIFSQNSSRPAVQYTYGRFSSDAARIARDEEQRAVKIAESWGLHFEISA